MSKLSSYLSMKNWNDDWPPGSALTVEGLAGEATTLGPAYLEGDVAVVDVEMPSSKIAVPLKRCHPIWLSAK